MKNLLLLASLLATSAWAVPTVSVSNSAIVASGTTISFSHTCAVGDNVSLNVIVAGLSSLSADNVPSSITARGVTSGANVTLSLNPFNADIGAIEGIQTWHLLGCTSGLAVTIVVTYPHDVGCGGACAVQAMALSVNNTNFYAPITSIIGSEDRILQTTCPATSTVNLTNVANDIVIAVWTGGGDTHTSNLTLTGGGSITEQANDNGTGNRFSFSYTSALGAGAHSISWTTGCDGGNDFRGALAVSIRQFVAYPIMSGVWARPATFQVPIPKQTALVSYSATFGDTNLCGDGVASINPGNINGATVYCMSNDGGDDGTRCPADYGVCIWQLTDFTGGTPTFSTGPNMTGYGNAGALDCAGHGGLTHNRTRMPYVFRGKLWVTGGCTDASEAWTDTRIWAVPTGVGSCNYKTWGAHSNSCTVAFWSTTGDKPTDALGFQWPQAADPSALLTTLVPISMGCPDLVDTCAIAPGLDPLYVYYFGLVIARHLKSAADPMDPSIFTFRKSDGNWTSTLADAQVFTAQHGGQQTMAWDRYHGVFIGMSGQFHGFATAPLPWGPWTDHLPASTADYQFQSFINALLTVSSSKVTAVISLNGPGSHDARLESLDLGPVNPIRAY